MTPEERSIEMWAKCRSQGWDDAITAMIREAVLEEREACAKVAEDGFNIDKIGGSTGNAWGTARNIVSSIRARNIT